MSKWLQICIGRCDANIPIIWRRGREGRAGEGRRGEGRGGNQLQISKYIKFLICFLTIVRPMLSRLLCNRFILRIALTATGWHLSDVLQSPPKVQSLAQLFLFVGDPWPMPDSQGYFTESRHQVYCTRLSLKTSTVYFLYILGYLSVVV